MKRAKVILDLSDYQKALVSSLKRNGRVSKDLFMNLIANGIAQGREEFKRYKEILESNVKVNPFVLTRLDEEKEEKEIYRIVEKIIVDSIRESGEELEYFAGRFNKMVINVLQELGKVKEKEVIFNEIKDDSISIIKNEFTYSYTADSVKDGIIYYEGEILFEDVPEVRFNELSLAAYTTVSMLSNLYTFGIRRVSINEIIGAIGNAEISLEGLKDELEVVEKINRHLLSRLKSNEELKELELVGYLIELPEIKDGEKIKVYESLNVGTEYSIKEKEGKFSIIRGNVFIEEN